MLDPCLDEPLLEGGVGGGGGGCVCVLGTVVATQVSVVKDPVQDPGPGGALLDLVATA